MVNAQSRRHFAEKFCSRYLCIMLIFVDKVDMFSLTISPKSIFKRSTSVSLLGSRNPFGSKFCLYKGLDSGDANTTANGDQAVAEMEALILSLSVETDDASRRAKLASIFSEKLSILIDIDGDGDENNHGIAFENLFHQVLVVVGDRIRMEAAVAFEKEKNQTNEKDSDSNKDVDDLPTFSLPTQRKSKIEQQLWALVDMMVQSKTLVRRATGQLGSERKFG